MEKTHVSPWLPSNCEKLPQPLEAWVGDACSAMVVKHHGDAGDGVEPLLFPGVRFLLLKKALLSLSEKENRELFSSLLAMENAGRAITVGGGVMSATGLAAVSFCLAASPAANALSLLFFNESVFDGGNRAAGAMMLLGLASEYGEFHPELVTAALDIFNACELVCFRSPSGLTRIRSKCAFASERMTEPSKTAMCLLVQNIVEAQRRHK